MHSAFETLIWVVCGLGLIVAVVALIRSGRTWDEFGKSRLSLDSDSTRTSPAAALERDAEIRQLLDARNARRIRRGEAPLDVDQELRRLTAPLADASLQQEIRQLVTARNYRRVRAGKPPLDVEAEVRREIESLTDI